MQQIPFSDISLEKKSQTFQNGGNWNYLKLCMYTFYSIKWHTRNKKYEDTNYILIINASILLLNKVFLQLDYKN